MKSIIHKGIFITLAATLTLSCASTPKSSNSTVENTNQVQEEEVVQPSASEVYSQRVESNKITLVSSPKQTTKGKIFTEPYTLKVVSSDGTPAESFEVSVIYPASRKNGEIVFEETMISTDSEGNATFLPPVPEFSFNSEISFFPKYEASDVEEEELAKIKELAESNTVKAPFMVQTNLKSAGGTLAIVDFNQNGKAITSNPISSSNLLMTLMKLGFVKIGNAPQEVTDAVIQNNEEKIWARAKSIAPSFIVFGTVKIDSNEKTDQGTTCVLTGSIKAMDSKTGGIIFATQKTVSFTEKNDWNALANARKTLAEQIAAEIKYGI